jgi:hypothetical protein
MGCKQKDASGLCGLVRVHGHVTACAGCTGPLALGEAAAPRGVDSAQRSGVTRQGADGRGLGPGDAGLVVSPV